MANRERHGMARTRIYNIWCDMKSRCSRKANKYYYNYGGRGIKVCEEWSNSFKKFYEEKILCL